MFRLHLTARDGSKHVLLYDQHTSVLTREDGSFLIAPEPRTKWEEFVPVSKDNPGKKIRAPKRLKIQLGLGCNYSCSYCLQSAEIHKASATSTRDAEIFLKMLDRWLEGKPERIEFWGGEPLLYWKKIEVLTPELKRRFPDAEMVMVTNGTLLTDEIIDRIDEWDFSVAISHDGPGMRLRGPDPLDDPEKLLMIDRLIKLRTPKHKFSFNAVLTPVSYDVEKVIEWFKERWPEVVVSFEGVVHDYLGNAESRFTEEQLSDLTSNLALQIACGTAVKSPMIQRKMNDFLQSVQYQRPSKALWQKCGMDRDDAIAVDLLGNVMTCQNVGGQGEHKIGHVNSFDKISLTTATHWSLRDECSSCPVLQLCKGSCMYQEGDQWAASCHAEFALNKAVLAGSLFYLTGMLLERIEGYMIRPQLGALQDDTPPASSGHELPSH